jgi:two-component system, NarL family, response regulator DevR
MSAAETLRVLVVDDHEIVRKGLVMLMSRQADLLVVGEAGTGAEALEKTHELAPDVVVLDIRLPDASGIEVCRDIRAHSSNIRVLMLTSYSDEEAVMGSIMAGASGYLLKEIHSQEIIEAIRRVGAGQSLLDPAVTASVLERVRRGRQDDVWTQLTEQEQRILELIAQGKTNREISLEVNLSDKTVKNYVSNILSKLEVSRRSQAAAYLAERRSRREYPQNPPALPLYQV